LFKQLIISFNNKNMEKIQKESFVEKEPKIIDMNKILNEEELEYAREGKIEWRKSGSGYVHADGIPQDGNELILSYEDNENWQLDGKTIFKS